jgi:hypothetical protein
MTVGSSLPVYPKKRTISAVVVMSQRGPEGDITKMTRNWLLKRGTIATSPLATLNF